MWCCVRACWDPDVAEDTFTHVFSTLDPETLADVLPPSCEQARYGFMVMAACARVSVARRGARGSQFIWSARAPGGRWLSSC